MKRKGRFFQQEVLEIQKVRSHWIQRRKCSMASEKIDLAIDTI